MGCEARGDKHQNWVRRRPCLSASRFEVWSPSWVAHAHAHARARCWVILRERASWVFAVKRSTVPSRWLVKPPRNPWPRHIMISLGSSNNSVSERGGGDCTCNMCHISFCTLLRALACARASCPRSRPPSLSPSQSKRHRVRPAQTVGQAIRPSGPRDRHPRPRFRSRLPAVSNFQASIQTPQPLPPIPWPALPFLQPFPNTRPNTSSALLVNVLNRGTGLLDPAPRLISSGAGVVGAGPPLLCSFRLFVER